MESLRSDNFLSKAAELGSGAGQLTFAESDTRMREARNGWYQFKKQGTGENDEAQYVEAIRPLWDRQKFFYQPLQDVLTKLSADAKQSGVLPEEYQNYRTLLLRKMAETGYAGNDFGQWVNRIGQNFQHFFDEVMQEQNSVGLIMDDHEFSWERYKEPWEEVEKAKVSIQGIVDRGEVQDQNAPAATIPQTEIDAIDLDNLKFPEDDDEAYELTEAEQAAIKVIEHNDDWKRLLQWESESQNDEINPQLWPGRIQQLQKALSAIDAWEAKGVNPNIVSLYRKKISLIIKNVGLSNASTRDLGKPSINKKDADLADESDSPEAFKRELLEKVKNDQGYKDMQDMERRIVAGNATLEELNDVKTLLTRYKLALETSKASIELKDYLTAYANAVYHKAEQLEKKLRAEEKTKALSPVDRLLHTEREKMSSSDVVVRAIIDKVREGSTTVDKGKLLNELTMAANECKYWTSSNLLISGSQYFKKLGIPSSVLADVSRSMEGELMKFINSLPKDEGK